MVAALLDTPGNSDLAEDFLFNVFCHADRMVTYDWCRRFAVVVGRNDPALKHFVALTKRLNAGEIVRSGFQRTVNEVFKLETPVGDVLFSMDDPISRRFFKTLLPGGRPHEPGIVAYLCKTLSDRDVFVDIGAHTGYLACIAGISGASVVTMEFQKPLNRIIEGNLALNRIRRANILEVAASDRDGTTVVPTYEPGFGAKLYSEQVNIRLSTFPPYGPVSQIVPTMRLDTFFAGMEETPTVIKIDAEGFELRILSGAQRLIADRKTTFIVEFHTSHVADFGTDVSEFEKLFPVDAWQVIHLQDHSMTELDPDGLRKLIARQDGTDNPHLIFKPR